MLTFAAAVFFLIITPGPGVLSAAGIGAAYGFKSGLRYVLGLLIGNNIVIIAVVSGVATLVVTTSSVRSVRFLLSTTYLIYLAFRIAFAGSELAFITADTKPGILTGILLQTINPKAYVVNTALFSGFSIFPEALASEVIWKLLIVNAIWLPIHFIWLWLGTILKKMDLNTKYRKLINIIMAASLLIVVALAFLSF